MTNPFWMIMMVRILGRGYVVWDKAAEIEFVAPGRAADAGDKVLRWFEVDVVGTDGAVVARARNSCTCAGPRRPDASAHLG